MDSLFSIDPGLTIWTWVNFLIFFAILVALGAKPIVKGLRAREEGIQKSIDDTESAKEQAKKFLAESEEKLGQAQQEMAEIISKGRQQAEDIIRKAGEEADKVKRDKVDEAVKEIESSKERAVKELRAEVADLVVKATEKILDEKLDKERHYKLIESYIEKLPKN